MSTNGESDQTVQKIIAEMETNLSVLSWMKAAEEDKQIPRAHPCFEGRFVESKIRFN